MEIPVGDLSSQGTRMKKKYSSQAFVGIPMIFFYHGDGDGKLFPSGEFSIAIPSPAEKRGENEKREGQVGSGSLH